MTDDTHPSRSVQRRMEAQQEPTPEPQGLIVLTVQGVDFEVANTPEADAASRRLLACLKACMLPDGTPIPTEALEGGAIGGLMEALTQEHAQLHSLGAVHNNAYLVGGIALTKLKGE